MKKLLALVIVIILGAVLNGTAPEYDLVEYRVSPGDTLCSIVSEYTSDKYDYREYIFYTEKENPGLEAGNLRVGQKILIAVPKER